jgi:predicted alpha/beta superfamily hydrolase
MNLRIEIWKNYNVFGRGPSNCWLNYLPFAKAILPALLIVLTFSYAEGNFNNDRQILRLYSQQLDDSFDISIEYFGNGVDTITIYVLEQTNRRLSHLKKVLNDSTHLFKVIGISQIKPTKSKRKNNFIPPPDGYYFDSGVSFFGMSHLFQEFLVEEVVAKYDEHSSQRILIGHSFAGVFALYLGLQELQPFQKIISISPSLWLNKNNFMYHYQKNSSLSFHCPTIVLYGKKEQLNKVGPSCVKLSDKIRDSDNIQFEEVDGNHQKTFSKMTSVHILEQ